MYSPRVAAAFPSYGLRKGMHRRSHHNRPHRNRCACRCVRREPLATLPCTHRLRVTSLGDLADHPFARRSFGGGAFRSSV